MSLKTVLCPLCSQYTLISNGKLVQGEFNVCCRIQAGVERPIHNTRTMANTIKSENSVSKCSLYGIDSVFPKSMTTIG